MSLSSSSSDKFHHHHSHEQRQQEQEEKTAEVLDQPRDDHKNEEGTQQSKTRDDILVKSEITTITSNLASSITSSGTGGEGSHQQEHEHEEDYDNLLRRKDPRTRMPSIATVAGSVFNAASTPPSSMRNSVTSAGIKCSPSADRCRQEFLDVKHQRKGSQQQQQQQVDQQQQIQQRPNLTLENSLDGSDDNKVHEASPPAMQAQQQVEVVGEENPSRAHSETQEQSAREVLVSAQVVDSNSEYSRLIQLERENEQMRQVLLQQQQQQQQQQRGPTMPSAPSLVVAQIWEESSALETTAVGPARPSSLVGGGAGATLRQRRPKCYYCTCRQFWLSCCCSVTCIIIIILVALITVGIIFEGQTALLFQPQTSPPTSAPVTITTTVAPSFSQTSSLAPMPANNSSSNTNLRTSRAPALSPGTILPTSAGT